MTKEEMEEIYELVLKSGLAPDLVYKDGDKYSDRFENFQAFAFYVAEKEREKFCSALAQLHDSFSCLSHPSGLRSKE
jgi:hypothetical protein